MSDLGAQRMLTPSGITRVVIRLEEQGFVRREPDPADGRAAFAALTHPGLEALRRAQVVHHATVRELYLGRLTKHELDRLAALFEKALPGVVSASPSGPRRLSAPNRRAEAFRHPQGGTPSGATTARLQSAQFPRAYRLHFAVATRRPCGGRCVREPDRAANREAVQRTSATILSAKEEADGRGACCRP